ncbi:MAG: bis(5'-nucleosyl)-tetraphosphatase (symmetrical) YqeK [Bacillota bacterium]
MKLEEATERLAQFVTKEVYQHSLRTSAFAVTLAERSGADPCKAAWAGLLHDVARCLENGALLSRAQEMGIIVDRIERELPVLLHGRVGAEIARREFGVLDPEVLGAIAAHTTGGPDPGLLDKVVFIADKAEPGRHWSGVETVRQMCLEDIHRAFVLCLGSAIQWLIENGKVIHPDSVEAWNKVVGAHGKDSGRVG